MFDCLREGFTNLGIATNGIPLPDKKTILVTGLARSGTTMLIQLLEHVMPTFADNVVNYEDRRFINGDNGTELIRRRNKSHSMWGHKRPNLYLMPDQIDKFRNPCLLVPIRDPLVIASRESIARETDFAKELSLACDGLANLCDFLTTTRFPAMAVSYEKTISQPGRTAEYIGRWLRENLSAADFCEPERADYEELARAERMNDW